MKGSQIFFREIRKYPSAIIGISIITLLVLIAVYTLIALPYREAIRLWRGGEGVWADYPRNARPVWLNLLPWNNYSETIIVDSSDGSIVKERFIVDETDALYMELTFDFPYDTFPREVVMFINGTY